MDEDIKKTIETPTDDNPIEVQGRWSAGESYFFFIPACWISEKPDVSKVKSPDSYPVIYDKTLSCGIRLTVRQDGLFLFDFKNYELGAPVYIPWYKGKDGFRVQIPKKWGEASQLAIDHAYHRCKVMNCFLACFYSSRSEASTILQFTSPSNHLRSEPNTYWNPLDAYYVLHSQKYDRKIIPINEISNAVSKLEGLIKNHGVDCLEVLHIIYQSHYLYSSFDFTNALLISWMASERLINQIYERHIESLQEEILYFGQKRNLFDGARKKKLSDGRTFSAGVIVEILALAKIIDAELYIDLEKARKARNNWIHRMEQSEKVETNSMNASHKLFELVYGEKMSIPIGVSYSY